MVSKRCSLKTLIAVPETPEVKIDEKNRELFRMDDGPMNCRHTGAQFFASRAQSYRAPLPREAAIDTSW